ncbi:hypothetical protein D3Y57_19095 [Sphingomonas paeninsulae]|uniref:Uncharacterized protein n=1 Tax=Sphingomonas paeninsulae TaxID=2319844 RepID=A0A494TJF9_SPHPE|nr:hypothetical protein [Sphingomonas paeninsulae]AYJ87644.1 hypothetical protein D3Y57_19095 [Sphingomonas paeninsulae]
MMDLNPFKLRRQRDEARATAELLTERNLNLRYGLNKLAEDYHSVGTQLAIANARLQKRKIDRKAADRAPIRATLAGLRRGLGVGA